MNELDNIVVMDVCRAMTVFFEKGKREKIVNRKKYGLTFCISDGQITYMHNGKEYVSDSSCVIILPKGQTYNIYGNKSGIFPVIDFECEGFSCDTHIKIPIRNVQSIMNDYEEIKTLSLFGNNRLKMISLFYEILSKLSASQSSIPNILVPAMSYIEENYSSQDITNFDIAKQSNISEVYLRKLFEKTYGISPRQYIINARIGKAKKLLTEGILKISEVSEQCGFTSIYYFSRLFKERTGLTPTEYMKQNKICKI